MNNNKEVLENLIYFRLPLIELKESLKALPFDIDQLVEINKFSIVEIFARYKNNEISPDDFQDWAKLVAYRTGIGFESQFEFEIINLLANYNLYRTLETNVNDYINTVYSKISKYY